MEITYISALAVLTGSVIGGLTSTGTTWLTQRAHARSGLLANEIARREALYRDFITAASKAYGDALVSSEPTGARAWVVSAPRTVASADKIILTLIDTYFSPSRSVRELRDLIKVGEGIDPLKEFSEAAREEVGKFKFT